MEMQIDITGHHVEITDALRNYVNDKLQKIGRRFSNITHVHVTLSVDKKYQQRAEAHINLARGNINATSEAEDMYAAIDLLVDKLDRQVTKHKEKMNNHGNGEDIL